MKAKVLIKIWNGVVTVIPIVLPLIVQHKDSIIKYSKKVKIN